MAISAWPLPTLSSMVDLGSRAKKAETHSSAHSDPIQLTSRFAALKEGLISGENLAVNNSWQRLLRQLPGEIDQVSSLGSAAIPTISFEDTTDPTQAEPFLEQLHRRGVGIVRGVVPKDTALAWSQEAAEYVEQNTATSFPPTSARPHDIFWSPPQVKARAHSNIIATQKFVMSIWKSKADNASVTPRFPISYADRMSLSTAWRAPQRGPYAHIDGGSVERWEPDGYGRAGTYKDIFCGRWEEYDPWESSSRLGVTSDLYHRAGACSIFRMFQGWLALEPITSSGPGSVRVCPLPRLATAYFLLRPFFSPASSPSTATSTTPAPPPPNGDQWAFNHPQNSILHGALPSYAQEISPTLHPHLQLDRSMIAVPDLEPGDYLVWHPDLIHSIHTPTDNEHPATTPTPMTTTGTPTYIYLPATPLTQTNALYLARQRKTFLLGHPGPDFGGGRGESGHGGRPGVQDVNDAGGDDGLRAMGLLPWDEEEADGDEERAVLAMANGILFPDLYDML
ncbi:hypothetical protein B0J18DRAFT_12904 [Chaetomium sp. MPI-SDFR-AT-0129]|nr:hypothetical protein B0J18DRAFT_12904 [Chaetomium sp. MPI-SDFR-AT-0129]